MMNFEKYLPGILLLSVVAAGCINSGNKEEEKVSTDEAVITQSDIIGNFVSDGYAQKSEGYDWVSVSVTDLGEDEVKIKVRSRADKKKPTCTFDAVAQKTEDNTYRSYIRGKGVLYTVKGDTLTIGAEFPENEGLLYFYCSGGASLAGDYARIEEAIDSTQVDQTLFSKVLELQGIGFNVSSIRQGKNNILTVTPFGLEIDNRPVMFTIEGQVYNAETEDLNSDGSPELLVYSRSDEGHAHGMVHGFSVNNKKSMSQIYFPPISKNDTIGKGYAGGDEFAVVETSFVQRFPIYEGADRTGKVRQITYKLREGEAMRKFEVVQVAEYELK